MSDEFENDMKSVAKPKESGLQGLGRGLNALFEDDEESAMIAEIEDSLQQVDAHDPAPVFAPEPELVVEEISIDEVDIEITETVIAVNDAVESAPVSAPVPETKSNGRGNRQSVGVEQLYPSDFQPRRIFDDNSIDDLADSIKQYGVLQPLLVRENPDVPGTYAIIAGERRWRAAQRAQVHEVPVIIMDIDELEAYKIALIENLQREDLDPIDEAVGYQRLIEEYGQTQEQLSRAVGRSRPHITNMLRLLNLPIIVQAHVSAGDLSTGHARAIITARDPEALAREVISKGLSVRQTEKLANDSKAAAKFPRTKGFGAPDVSGRSKEAAIAGKDADTLALERDIGNALGMDVSIDSADGKSGKISVSFKTLDQLDEVLHRLAHFPGTRQAG